MSDIFTAGESIQRRKVRVFAAAAAGTLVVPANCAIDRIYVKNRTANAVTGGLKFGTSAGATDLVAAGAVTASGVNAFTASIPAIGQGADRTVYYDAVTAWNGASVDIVVTYTKLI